MDRSDATQSRGVPKMSAVAIRAAGWLAAMSVVIISLVPGSLRPHVLSSSYEEHCLAYIAVGCLLGLGRTSFRQRVVIGSLLVVAAGSLEIAQLFIAGRTASVADFAASVLGAWVGLTLARGASAT
jgi:VanZ family protein